MSVNAIISRILLVLLGLLCSACHHHHQPPHPTLPVMPLCDHATWLITDVTQALTVRHYQLPNGTFCRL